MHKIKQLNPLGNQWLVIFVAGIKTIIIDRRPLPQSKHEAYEAMDIQHLKHCNHFITLYNIWYNMISHGIYFRMSEYPIMNGKSQRHRQVKSSDAAE